MELLRVVGILLVDCCLRSMKIWRGLQLLRLKLLVNFCLSLKLRLLRHSLSLHWGWYRLFQEACNQTLGYGVIASSH